MVCVLKVPYKWINNQFVAKRALYAYVVMLLDMKATKSFNAFIFTLEMSFLSLEFKCSQILKLSNIFCVLCGVIWN